MIDFHTWFRPFSWFETLAESSRAIDTAASYCIVRHENPIRPGCHSRTSSQTSAGVGTGGRFSFRLTSRVS